MDVKTGKAPGPGGFLVHRASFILAIYPAHYHFLVVIRCIISFTPVHRGISFSLDHNIRLSVTLSFLSYQFQVDTFAMIYQSFSRILGRTRVCLENRIVLIIGILKTKILILDIAKGELSSEIIFRMSWKIALWQSYGTKRKEKKRTSIGLHSNNFQSISSLFPGSDSLYNIIYSRTPVYIFLTRSLHSSFCCSQFSFLPIMGRYFCNDLSVFPKDSREDEHV